MWPIQTAAIASESRPRKSSGTATTGIRRCTGADDEACRYRTGLASVEQRARREAREPAPLVAAEARGRLCGEPVDELPDRHAAHLGEPARAKEEAGERVVVGPALPGLEVLAEGDRGAVADVARPERAPDRPVGLALDARRRLADLVRHEVVVHRDDAVGVAGIRQLEQRDAPEAEPPRRPRAERRGPAGVVAEAVPRQHRVEGGEVPLETRRAHARE